MSDKRRMRRAIRRAIFCAAFTLTAATLFLLRSRARPRLDPAGFELGYYVMACRNGGGGPERGALVAEITRLSSSLGASLPSAGSGCPDGGWLTRVAGGLARGPQVSVLLGEGIGLFEATRNKQIAAGFAASGSASDAESAAIDGLLNEIASILPDMEEHLGDLKGGRANAAELQRRLFPGQPPLRYPIDTDAERRAFALGYYMAPCSMLKRQQLSRPLAAEIARLGETFRLAKEELILSDAGDQAPCPTDEALDRLTGRLPVRARQTMRLGEMAYMHAFLKLVGDNERMNRTDQLIADTVGPLFGSMKLLTIRISFDPERIYHALFDTSETLLSPDNPLAKDPGP